MNQKSEITSDTRVLPGQEVLDKIQFQIMKKTETFILFAGVLGEETVGYAKVLPYARYDGRAPELYDMWLTEEGYALMELPAFCEALFAYLKEQGCRELYLQNKDIDFGDEFGFELEAWDNSGWYPKYTFRRKLE